MYILRRGTNIALLRHSSLVHHKLELDTSSLNHEINKPYLKGFFSNQKNFSVNYHLQMSQILRLLMYMTFLIMV